MASKQTSKNLISNRYASALYELSSDGKFVDQVLEDLLVLQNYINKNKEFKLLIISPLISSSDKLNVINTILSNHSASDLTIKFMKVLSHNKRINFLSSIIERYQSINSEKRGDILADITSADELTDKQKNVIKDQLKSIIGEKLSLNFYIDQSIIGGLVVKIGSKMIDTSINSKINKLKISMKGA